MLPGAGLGDDPALAHPPSQQRLTQRVIDFVRARVVEVLPLEEHTGADRLAETRGVVQQRGTPGVVPQQPVELLLKLLVVHGFRVGRGQLVECRDQCLGNVASAVRPEPSGVIGLCHRSGVMTV